MNQSQSKTIKGNDLTEYFDIHALGVFKDTERKSFNTKALNR